MRVRCNLLSALVLSVATVTACAPTIRSASREASESAVKGAASQLSSPDADKQGSGGSSSAKEAGADTTAEVLSKQVSRGVLEALQSDAAQRRLSAITTHAVRAAVQESIQQLGKPATIEQLDGLTEAMTASAARGMAESLPETVGPAMSEVVNTQLVPAVGRAISSPEMQGHLSEATRNAAHDAVLGTASGLSQAFDGNADSRGTAEGLAQAVRGWLWLLLAILGLVSLTMVAAAVIVVARTRRARTEVARLEDATLLLATAVRDKEHTTEADEIASIVQQALESSARARERHGILGALRMRRTS